MKRLLTAGITLFFFPLFMHASVIDDTDKWSRIRHDVACSSYGTVNWKPTINVNTPGADALTIGTTITGHAWGNEIGWINFTPTGEGVFLDADTGVITGKAYSSAGSWITFNPTSVSGGTTVGVTINENGEFEGWAWVSGMFGGWMRFDCGSANTCVKTDWRPNAQPSSTTGGGTSGSGASTQKTVPEVTPSSATTTPSSMPTETLPQPPRVYPKNTIERPEIPTMEVPTVVEDNIDVEQDAEDLPGEFPVADVKKSVTRVPEYYVEEVFGKNAGVRIPGTDSPCVFCIVKQIRATEAEGTTGVIKFGFIPHEYTAPVPTARIPGIASDVDFTTLVLFFAPILLLIRGIFVLIMRLL